MKILALEFSSPQRSAAVVNIRRDDLREPLPNLTLRRDELHESLTNPTLRRDELHESLTNPTLRRDELHESHSFSSRNALSIIETIETSKTAALEIIDQSLHAAQLDRAQIDCIAVGIGPGSYTGIRAAIAIAQGWQLARDVKILAVSSAECLAAQARADGLLGRAHVIIDAQRDEFYLATYELAPDSCREIDPLRIVPAAEIHQRANAGETLIGPEVTRWFPTGKLVFPRAATLGTLALDRTNFIPGEKLEPIYLRETKFVKAPPPRIIS